MMAREEIDPDRCRLHHRQTPVADALWCYKVRMVSCYEVRMVSCYRVVIIMVLQGDKDIVLQSVTK
jgi:hypothetical protein